MSAVARRIGLYALDQDLRTTRTLGVCRFTQRLLAELARLPDPGFELLVWVTDQNAGELAPAVIPPWMRIIRRRGSYGRGFRRLWADHVLAAWLPRQARVAAVHFPKGWLPLLGLGPVKSVISLHDTIPNYYLHHHPGYGSRLHWRYFDWIMRRSARRAERVLTSSHASAALIRALVPESSARLAVMAAGGLDEPSTPAPARGGDLLVMGSSAPHKATAQTLGLLDAYGRHRGQRVSVVVVGVQDLGEVPNVPATPNLAIRVEGRVSRERLDQLLRTSRALILLSEIEGFGLPLLESYAAGTPVCYRRASSLAEIMDDAPGGWDGCNAEGFCRALDETLAMTPARIDAVRASLRQRYDFRATVAQLVAEYRALLPSRLTTDPTAVPAPLFRYDAMGASRRRPLVLALDLLAGALFFWRRLKRFPPQPRKILVVRIDQLGDVVLTTPVFRALRAGFPDAEIHALVRPLAVDLLRHHPHLDQLHAFDFPWFRSGVSRGWLAALRYMLELRRQRFDLVIDVRPNSRNILCECLLGAYLVASPQSGFSTLINRRFYIHYGQSAPMHAIDRNLACLGALGLRSPSRELELPVAPDEAAAAARLVVELGGGPYAVVAPGSLAANKRWNTPGWVQVCDALVVRGLRVLLVGTADDEFVAAAPVLAQVSSSTRVHSLCGRTSVGEFVALIAAARVVVSVDSAAQHIAFARRVPSVALFGPIDPAVWGHHEPRHRSLLAPQGCTCCNRYTCGHDNRWECMQALVPERVIAEIHAVLDVPVS